MTITGHRHDSSGPLAIIDLIRYISRPLLYSINTSTTQFRVRGCLFCVFDVVEIAKTAREHPLAMESIRYLRYLRHVLGAAQTRWTPLRVSMTDIENGKGEWTMRGAR